MKLGSLSAKLALSIAAALTMLPALARAQHFVIFTEQTGVLTEASDLFPTITWLPTGTDLSGTEHWERPEVPNDAGQIIFSIIASGPMTWAEPGVGEGVNGVNFDNAFSDLLHPDRPPGAPDSTFQPGTVKDADGFATSASVKWIDLGDSAVPEATPTLGLLGLACLSLIGLRRYLSPQTATI